MLTGFAIRIGAALALAAAVVAVYVGWAGHQREIGRAEIRAEWNADKLAAANAATRETFRRLEAHDAIQRRHADEMAAARDAAARNAADADRVRTQSAESARQWANRLADSPTAADLASAASAIAVCADMLGRADRAAGILAEYADAARAAGNACERNYDALTAR